MAGQVEEQVEEEEAGTNQEVQQETTHLCLRVVEGAGLCEPADCGDEVGGDKEEAVQPGQGGEEGERRGGGRRGGRAAGDPSPWWVLLHDPIEG